MYVDKKDVRDDASASLGLIVGALRRGSFTLGQNSNLFPTLRTFCINGVGPYKFSLSDPRYYYRTTFDNEPMPTVADFSAGSVMVCSNAFGITTNANLALALDAEREMLKPFTLFSILWYVPLALGFALKFAKNMSDLKKAR